jgi:hypothetical protein
MLRSTFLLPVLLVGCAQQQAADAPPTQPEVAVAPQPAANAPAATPAPKPEPPAPPPSFAFTPDLTGKALARVVAPAAPPPVERLGAGPKPRAVPAKVLEPDTATRAKYLPPPLLMKKPAGAVKFAAPPEAVPRDLGAGADGVPARPVLPVAAVVTERAPDVNLPPPLPTLGRPASDRVSLDDPTGDAGNAVVVAGAAKVPLAAAGFLRVAVPDPFELGAQVRPKVPPAAEPDATPVPVNPHRVK